MSYFGTEYHRAGLPWGPPPPTLAALAGQLDRLVARLRQLGIVV